MIEAKSTGKNTLVTFGGAFSNHIAATAAAGKEGGFNTIGIIRGDELNFRSVLNPTLQSARDNGMRLEFVNRETYRYKNTIDLENILEIPLNDCYILPEGGTNNLAVKGCMEILSEADAEFDYVCCAVGTGGTIAGIINSSHPHQKVLGFPALIGSFLSDEIRKFASQTNWELVTDYEFGGYAKVPAALVDFINSFHQQFGIPLDPVYTGKLVYGVMNMISNNYFRAGSNILIIHTGGLQGITGINLRLKSKHSPLIDTHD